MTERITEISFEVAASEAAVIDGYCHANNIKRTVVMRRLLKEWSDKKLHEAISIVRVAGVKPEDTGADRND